MLFPISVTEENATYTGNKEITGTLTVGGAVNIIKDGSDPNGWAYGTHWNRILYDTDPTHGEPWVSAFVFTPSGDLSGVTSSYDWVEIGGTHTVGSIAGPTATVDINAHVNVTSRVGGLTGQANWSSDGTLTGADSRLTTRGLYGVKGESQIYDGVVPFAKGVVGWVGLYGGSVAHAAAFFAAPPGGGAVAAGGINAGLFVADWSGEGANTYALWYDSPGVFRVNQAGVMAYYNPAVTKYAPGAVDYERIVQQWNSNVAEIGLEAGGTGTLRPLRFLADHLQIPNFEEFSEMTAPAAPAANKARLYAEDSGGKTRLMVRFPSGSAVQVAIEP